MKPFSPHFFADNRRALLERLDVDMVVVPAHCTLQRSADTSYPFRQDSNFWYLTGIDEPDCILVMTAKETYLITPTRSRMQTIFDGAINETSLQKQSGVDQNLDYRNGWQKVKKKLQPGTRVGFPLPSTQLARAHSLALNPGRRLVLQKLRRIQSSIEVVDIRLALTHMRLVKQPAEIAAITQAIDITCQTFQEVFTSDWYKHYTYEYEVEAAMTAGFRKRGAQDHAYAPIVAADKHATTLHYVSNNGPLVKGGMLLVDAGAEFMNYSADITRVYPIAGRFTARQRAIVAAVHDVQNFACRLLKPGVLFKDYEQQIEEYMGTTLKNLGVIKSLNRKNIRKYYPHATSHMLGLDVHDAADYSVPLLENMVLTVEPGIYIPSEKIGVRIEDNVVITKDGARVLSTSLPVS